MTYQTRDNSMLLTGLYCIPTLELDFINDLWRVIDNKNLGFDNSNYIIYQLFHYINKHVFSSIQNKINNKNYPFEDLSEEKRQNLLKLCEDRIDDFSPELNGIASRFNNELDQADIKDNKLEKITNNVIEML